MEKTYMCSRSGCCYATGEAFSYCPLCGALMFALVTEGKRVPVIELLAEQSDCEAWPLCRPDVQFGAYECDGRGAGERRRCFFGLYRKLEALERDFRTLREAFREAGLPVSLQPDPELTAHKMREAYRNDPEFR